MTRSVLASRFPLAALLAMPWQMMVLSAPNAFLSRVPSPLMEGLSVTEARALAEEIESLFGEGSTHGRLGPLEDALRPTYVSLAPTGSGGLGHAASRYILHRYFQQRHGWLVPGLDPEGGAWNATSPAAILEGRAPAYLQQAFEERLEARRMDLHALAVLAATFEQLVRIEAAARLDRVYRVLEIAPEASVSGRDLDKLLEMNMLVSYFGDAEGDVRRLRLIAADPQMSVPGWSDTEIFLRDARQALAYTDRALTNPFIPHRHTFDDVLHIVQESNNVYGRFQDQECQHLKNLLLPYEDNGTGRVRLSLFHGLARSGHVQFSERAEFLRHLGTLDESEPGNPKVIIANWLLSSGNCLGTSGYYSYCCINECSSLMGHLEHELAAPRVDPHRLAFAVARLSSSTVAAPRNLSTVMLERLHDIAARQGGSVPLHGRLFAEWLHYAFPRECPYPHEAGAYRVSSAADWERASGMPSVLHASEYDVHGEELGSNTSGHGALHGELDWEHAAMDALKEQAIQWADKEDALVPWAAEEELALASGIVTTSLRVLAMASAVLGVGGALLQQLSAVKGQAGYSSPQKYVV